MLSRHILLEMIPGHVIAERVAQRAQHRQGAKIDWNLPIRQMITQTAAIRPVPHQPFVDERAAALVQMQEQQVVGRDHAALYRRGPKVQTHRPTMVVKPLSLHPLHHLGRHQVVVQMRHDPQRSDHHQPYDQHPERQRQHVAPVRKKTPRRRPARSHSCARQPPTADRPDASPGAASLTSVSESTWRSISLLPSDRRS